MKALLRFIGKKKPDNTTVTDFDLSRYAGRWYEIARYDHRFEHGLTNVTAEYSVMDDGSIKVFNAGLQAKTGKKSEIIGRAKTTGTTGLLRVSFFWKFYSDYRVMALAEDYTWALVGAGKSDRYLWILSRTETLNDDTLKTILAEAERRGYDTQRLITDNKQK